ncbi:MAG: type II toxin-antitoxin system Phd/YefM family antitoxin [Alphaproteobacteria bacterium]|nr:type II toxin-antitoxin system Phd/YefM family antitoxin [Alphaproteobacteria bacterium]
MREIQLKDAKARLSAVVDDAVAGKPAVITRHGKRQAVVVSFAEWEKLTKRKKSFGWYLTHIPLGDIELPRLTGGVRPVDF